jgi:RND superfamily putative drug exporter
VTLRIRCRGLTGHREIAPWTTAAGISAAAAATPTGAADLEDLMSSLLYRMGRFAGRHPWRVLAAWALIAASAFLLNTSFGGETTETFRLPGVESQRAADALEERFPQQSIVTSNVIFHDDGGLTRPETKAAVAESVARLADVPHTIGVNDPFAAEAPTLSADGKTAFATVAHDIDTIGPAEFDAADAATATARAAGVQVEYDGNLGYAKGDAEPGSEKVGVAVAIVVLAVAFGSLVAMSLPIMTSLIAILIGVSAIGVLSGRMDVPEIANIVALMLGLGVGIDYALFILARHRQNLAAGMPVPESIGRANATAGLSVLFAGVTVVVAIAGLQVAGIPMLTTMGWASAIMVVIAMLAAVTLLPGLLGLVGRRVNSARLPFVKQRAANNPASRSARWAARVVARPVRYALPAAAVLGMLAVPLFSMHLGFADPGNDGPSTTTRKAYDLVAEGYGPGSNGPLQVVLEGDATSADGARLRVVEAALRTTDGVASVAPAVVSPHGDLAVFAVTPTTSPQDSGTYELVERLRTDVLPGAVSGAGLQASVTGGTALSGDVSSRLQERMPWFLGAVIGLSFVLLMILFRSILVPLKAALLNVLSVGAAYGVLVAVFQWGWGSGLIGVEEKVPIMPLAPMLMFAILFGLSIDYEVFLLSRIREQYVRHGRPGRAIVEGVGSTARVITSAALIMISVFGAFILMSDVTTKMFGVGLSVAVLLDVTLVRMVLVPAAMSLLGHRAWWLPAWLDRALPLIDLEGHGDGSRHAVTGVDAGSGDGEKDEHEVERSPALI